MHIRYLITIAAMAILPVAAGAQPAATDPANPAASASPPYYKSAFRDYRQWRELPTSPTKRWRAANDDLAASGMSGMPDMNAETPTRGEDMPHRHDGHEGK